MGVAGARRGVNTHTGQIGGVPCLSVPRHPPFCSFFCRGVKHRSLGLAGKRERRQRQCGEQLGVVTQELEALARLLEASPATRQTVRGDPLGQQPLQNICKREGMRGGEQIQSPSCATDERTYDGTQRAPTAQLRAVAGERKTAGQIVR